MNIRKPLSFAVPIFLSSYLVFLIQPLIANYFLPWFGGTPALWATCMMFFQIMLLIGYSYAHLGRIWMSRKNQTWLHLILVSFVLILFGLKSFFWVVPILPSLDWVPDKILFPTLTVFGLLLVSIGLPYVLLCSVSPLLQDWFGYIKSTDATYRLYAVSNAGSLLGLLTYPFLFEPFMTVQTQAIVWSVCFVLALFGIGSVTVLTLYKIDQLSSEEKTERYEVNSEIFNNLSKNVLLWIWWAFFPSALFLSVTNWFSHVAPVVPLLWIIPLTLYLTSLILCFNNSQRYHRNTYSLLWFVALGIVLVLIFYKEQFSLVYHVTVLSYMSFLGCMVGHGELISIKPNRTQLTTFYLSMATGGALGGIFVSLLAPVLFNGYWEFHTVIILGVLAVVATLINDETSWLSRFPKYVSAILIICIVLSIEILFLFDVGMYVVRSSYASRNFFGTTRVIKETVHMKRGFVTRKKLTNGNITHGFQYMHPSYKDVPTSYYRKKSGVGRAILSHPDNSEGSSLKVGVVGLGVGTVAAYGDTGDDFTFYEINPDVINLDRGDSPTFTYVKDCPCATNIISGDARISLRRQWKQKGSKQYDVLILDAFQGESPPVHLLTKGAIRLYINHLDSDGIIAFHVSNQYLKLEQLLYQYAQIFDLEHAQYIDISRKNSSRWVLMSQNDDVLQRDQLTKKSNVPIKSKQDIPIWTDHYSSLISIVKF